MILYQAHYDNGGDYECHRHAESGNVYKDFKNALQEVRDNGYTFHNLNYNRSIGYDNVKCLEYFTKKANQEPFEDEPFAYIKIVELKD